MIILLKELNIYDEFTIINGCAVFTSQNLNIRHSSFISFLQPFLGQSLTLPSTPDLYILFINFSPLHPLYMTKPPQMPL